MNASANPLTTTRSQSFKRCAFYGRYSSQMQRPSSIEDQERTCRTFAAEHEWVILEEHRYVDAGVSGTSERGRKGFEGLKAAMEMRVFDYILVDDTSRLSRNQADVLKFIDIADHHNIGVRFVSQQLDSKDESFAVLFNHFSLFDSVYVKRLSKKVFSGQLGRVLARYHVGSIAYGYRGVKISDLSNPMAIGRATTLGTKLEVIEDEARILRRICKEFADGCSKHRIAVNLNLELVPPPHSAGLRSQQIRQWTSDTINKLLRNEKYRGVNVWNVSQQREHPETGRVRKEYKPGSDHVRVEIPELRIVDDDLWDRVQARLNTLADKQAARVQGGYNRAKKKPYLYSGLLICGVCGEQMKIGGLQGKSKYECRNHRLGRGCTNSLTIREDKAAKHITEVLATQLSHPEYLADLVAAVWGELKQAWERQQSSVSSQEIPELELARKDLQRKVDHLMNAVESGQDVGARLGGRQFELGQIEKKLSIARGKKTLRISKDELDARVRASISNLHEALKGDGDLARTIVQRHVRKLLLYPGETEAGPTFCVVGEVDLFAPDPTRESGVLLGCEGTLTPEQHTDPFYRFHCELYTALEVECPFLVPLCELLASRPELSLEPLKPGAWAKLLTPLLPPDPGGRRKMGYGAIGRSFRVHRELLAEKLIMVKIKSTRDPGHLYQFTLKPAA